MTMTMVMVFLNASSAIVGWESFDCRLQFMQPRLRMPQAVAVGEAEGEAEGEADSLPPEDAEWWTSTLYGGCTPEKLVPNSHTS